MMKKRSSYTYISPDEFLQFKPISSSHREAMSKFVIFFCAGIFVSAANAGTESPLEIAKKRPLEIIKREISNVNNAFSEAKRELRRFSENSSSKIDVDIHYERFASRLAELGTMVEKIQKCDDDVKETSLRIKHPKVVMCLSRLVHETKALCSELKSNLEACIDRVRKNGVC